MNPTIGIPTVKNPTTKNSILKSLSFHLLGEETKLKEEKISNAEDSGALVEAKGSAEAVEDLPVLSPINNVIFEPANSKPVEADGVELKNGGDSMGEAIHVKMFFLFRTWF